MRIDTRYDIGHTFWVPRSFKRMVEEELCFEGETWKREVHQYQALTKKKEVIGIEVRVNNYKGVPTARVYYSVTDAGCYNQLSQTYADDEINDYTEEQAHQIAKGYADKELTYYGN